MPPARGHRAQETAHRSVRLELPPAAIVGPAFPFLALDIPAKNLVIRVAVGIEEVEGLFVECEQVRMQQSVPGFMRERGPPPGAQPLCPFRRRAQRKSRLRRRHSC